MVVGEGTIPETNRLLREVYLHFVPNKILLLANGASRKYLEERLEAVRGMQLLDGKPAVYVCQDFACQAPVTTPEELRKLLSAN